MSNSVIKITADSAKQFADIEEALAKVPEKIREQMSHAEHSFYGLLLTVNKLLSLRRNYTLLIPMDCRQISFCESLQQDNNYWAFYCEGFLIRFYNTDFPKSVNFIKN